MTPVTIRRAKAADAARLNRALAKLSAHLGDTHNASDAAIEQAGFGPSPSFIALLAERSEDVVGVAMFSQVFSTVMGASGVLVSDLWIEETMRGEGLGRRLLAAAGKLAAEEWGTAYLKLSVSNSNADARAAYARLGFTPILGETPMILGGALFETLKGGS